MARVEDSGPAFPVSDLGIHGASGMTLRQWYAGQAISAVIAICGSDTGRQQHSSMEDYFAAKALGVADALIAAELCGAPIAPAPAWLPIETAPKDGTAIDLWHREFGRHADHYWGVPQHECGEAGQYCDSEWHSQEDGWVDSSLNEWSFGSDEFTHWMPLPAAPVSSCPPSPTAASSPA